MSKHQRLDRTKWAPWAFVGDNGAVMHREYAIAHLAARAVNASSNATVILERMVRRGRVAWYEKMKR